MLSDLSPFAVLLPYQISWACDPSRFKIWCASRQIGKSFGTAFEVVSDAIETGQDWVILSAGDRQAREFMEKVVMVAEIFRISFNGSNAEDPIGETYVSRIDLTNGAKILALPANPKTARGFSGNLVLDEFAFHEDPIAIWRAAYPTITNPLKGDLKVRVLSTPSGKNNKFYDLWASDGALQWSRHKTTIHDAKAAGLDVDIEAIKAGLDDPDGFPQEYECQFLEEATQYFPTSLVESCYSDRATSSSPLLPLRSHPRYGGNDIGRHKDLWVFWVNQLIDGAHVSEDISILERTGFAEQQRMAGERIQVCAKTAVDATGMGEETGERLMQRYGEHKVEPCKLTSEFKNVIFPNLKGLMQKGKVDIPDDPKIKGDLISIEKQVTAGGTVRYVAKRTADGHADRTNALALACYAARDDLTDRPFTQERIPQVQRNAFQVGTVRF